MWTSTKAMQILVLLGAPELCVDAAFIMKRDDTTSVRTTTLTDAVWTATVSSTLSTITPYAFDGVTVSASSETNATTPWVSLDSSGIPYLVTPTVTDGSTLSASPTPTNTKYPTPVAQPPVLRCLNDRVPSYTNPFCFSNNTEFVAGEIYWLTWNPLYWNPYESSTDVEKVKFKMRNYPDDDDTVDDVTTSDWLVNDNGYYAFEAKESFITDDNDGYLQLYLSPMITSDTDSHIMDTVTGPMVRIVTSDSSISRVPSDNAPDDDDDDSSSNTSSNSSSSGSKSNNVKTIVPAVIVPVVVVGMIAFFVIFYFKRKRNQSKGVTDGSAPNTASSSPRLFGSKGYVGSKKERMGTGVIRGGEVEEAKETSEIAASAHENPFHDSSSFSSPLSTNKNEFSSRS